MIEMHGDTRREHRLRAQEEFRQNPEVIVLVATDAAGEGVNLQVANLMVNYDLPWNPNRIEQRFGRIHRIGQMDMCHLWNLVATETREGAVFDRLFSKLEEENKALGGKVFDILGQSFEDKSLRDLLIEAIRLGDTDAVRSQISRRSRAHWIGPTSRASSTATPSPTTSSTSLGSTRLRSAWRGPRRRSFSHSTFAASSSTRLASSAAS